MSMNNDLEITSAGFTLIELLVTLAIFGSVLTAASNIFLYTQRLQHRTESEQAIQADARFALEVIAQEVRRSNIDYGFYGGSISSNPQDTLALVASDGSQVQFRRVFAGSRGLIQISQDGGGSWLDLTPADLSVASLAFYASPSADPFIQNPTTNQPPLVTVVISTVGVKDPGSPTFLQTSASSRQYLR